MRDEQEIFERKKDQMARLIKEWNNTYHTGGMSLGEFLLRNGVDVVGPAKPRLGVMGTAVISDTLGVRGFFGENKELENNELVFWRVPIHTGYPTWSPANRVTEFTPDIVVTEDDYQGLVSTLQNDDIVAGVVFDILKEWAEELGLNI